ATTAAPQSAHPNLPLTITDPPASEWRYCHSLLLSTWARRFTNRQGRECSYGYTRRDVILAVISAAEHLRALQDRLGEDPAIAVFADTDSIKALETIAATCPRFVALNTTFA